ncbi:hypothetical protein ELS19_05105 [Halogeometricum borinquense]|uniref:Uncharacterized protein n=1 Tax=Halogeometricum borinquense TaxID=60847 RepID=A0A482THJ5_9EURY|nr:hypothetical protein [Halogeometricum borinquense]RYJ13403.1 hypothetical protein ELS19_05105 [Halogeometricum borinquense]
MSLQADSRGVSEVLGFVLVFGLVIASVGTVYAFGVGELRETRDFERVNNAERAFEVFADNVADVARRGAPSRGTELKLSDSTLGYGETMVNVSLDTTPATPGSDMNNSTGSISLSPVVMTLQDAGEVRYATGAVMRTDGNGPPRMTHEPDFIFDKDRAVVQLVRSVPRGTTQVGGERIARIRTVKTSRSTLLTRTETPVTLRFNVTSPYAPAWGDYLESEGFTCDPYTDDSTDISCSLDDVSRVTIVRVTVETTFE